MNTKDMASSFNAFCKCTVFFVMMMALSDMYSENPLGDRLQYFIEKGRREVQQQAALCARQALTLKQCAKIWNWKAREENKNVMERGQPGKAI